MKQATEMNDKDRTGPVVSVRIDVDENGVHTAWLTRDGGPAYGVSPVPPEILAAHVALATLCPCECHKDQSAA